MSTLIKLCGFRDPATLQYLEGQAVDMIGFILAESRRRVSTEQLVELVQAAPAEPKKTGVFVNPSMQEIDAVMQKVRLDIIQLHGQETPDFCSSLRQNYGVSVMKVIHVGSEQTSFPEAYAGRIDYLLLDTFDPAEAGGTGRAFQWKAIPAYKNWCSKQGIPLLVAGGITPDNAPALLSDWKPDGIDLSSGIETNGVKDPEKIKLLMERVNSYVSHAK